MKKIIILMIGFAVMFLINLPAQTTIFFDSFESGEIDTTYWEPIPGPTFGIIEVILDPTAPDDFFSLRMGKTSDSGGNNTNDLRLHLDLSGYEQVALEFWISDYSDENGPFDEIRFSDDGGANFEKVLQLYPQDWNNSWGKLPPLDVDFLADSVDLSLTDQFVISFRQFDDHDFINNGGWVDGFAFDAFHVYDPQTNYASLPYSNGFESQSLDNTSGWSFPAIPVPGTTEIERIRPGGLVEIFEDATAPEGNFALRLGRRNDGNSTTNAVDIHLDLAGKDQVDLEFWIYDFADEDHLEDGIFFSNDGGVKFKKVFDFFPTRWNNFVWGKLPPFDVDMLAAENGIAFSDIFVIRIQQRDDHDFINNGGWVDGLGFDEIKIGDPNIVYVDSFPFFDDFESSQFRKMWRWGNPFYPDSTARDGELRIGGLVDISQSNPHEGFFHARVGRRNDGESTTNALDLHLNLSRASEVLLNFWIADAADETGPSDGIWFSNDGGLTFTQIYSFDPSNWANFTYQEIEINISDSAAAHNLILTEQCIIRFQQNGVHDFINNGGWVDGFWIDDVSIDAVVGIDNGNELSSIPGKFTLSQNYPNPFNPSTTIEFALPSVQTVSLKVYNTLGQEVAALLSNERVTTGTQRAVFDAGDLPSGVYYYRITAGEFTEARKMLLVR